MKLLHSSPGIRAQEWALSCDLQVFMYALNSFLWSLNDFKMLLTVLDRFQKILTKHWFRSHWNMLKNYQTVDIFFLTEMHLICQRLALFCIFRICLPFSYSPVYTSVNIPMHVSIFTRVYHMYIFYFELVIQIRCSPILLKL